jgi:demethylmenaquinone methyltransferase/2-methoxy-6-polyprenyl-1,4-benzoquinol methylase
MSEAVDPIIRNLAGTEALRQPLLRQAMARLDLPAGSRGLDIGAGIGLQSVMLASAIQPGGGVVGMDISLPLLSYARGAARATPAARQVSFTQADMARLPFEERSFDWAWSADCVGYPAGDLRPILKQLCRIVRPSGLVALLGWSSQQFLPGHAMLEARLNAACNAYAPWLDGVPPELHFRNALPWLREAGLVDARSQTVVGDLRGPLSPQVRRALCLVFEMLWGQPSPEARQEDTEQFQRLCMPDSPECIADDPAYRGSFTYTMFTARVPQDGGPS